MAKKKKETPERAPSERPVGRKLPVMRLSEYVVPERVHLTEYHVPESITLTLTRDEALALCGAIEGALSRAQRSLHPLLSRDVRTLERATYQLIGMPVPDWLDEAQQ